ncbi:MAG: sensor domain-containing diguanylate cyclase [Deltaproteobacteria bacterium]|nr:sensor domain-containing diguanylate cyclase [Kofleriaceae bacterium]
MAEAWFTEGDDERGHPELDALARALATSILVRTVTISAVDAAGQHFIGAHGIPTALMRWRTSIDVSPLCRHVIAAARPVIVYDARRRAGRGNTSLASLGVVGYAGVPVIVHEMPVAALAAIEPALRAWSARDLEILRVFADVAAAILRPASRKLPVPFEAARDRRTGELELLALHDELTGLLNRRGFYAVAGGQLAIARRKQLPGVVLFIDVDGLKQCNDHLGHAAGDDLLRAAAGVLRATFREADTIGRIGGDEFVVFTVDSGGQDLPVLLGRVTEELRRINQERAPGAALRWSVGAASFGTEDTPDLDRLIVEADRRMYVAKRTQRLPPAAE